MIELGQQYRDKVSGWQGVATARYEYLNGCVRIEVSAADEHGCPKSFVFDEQQLELVEAPAVKVKRRKIATGGPQDATAIER